MAKNIIKFGLLTHAIVNSQLWSFDLKFGNVFIKNCCILNCFNMRNLSMRNKYAWNFCDSKNYIYVKIFFFFFMVQHQFCVPNIKSSLNNF